MRICVTGCAGFVGSWICEKAIKAGHTVVGLDNLSSNVNYTPKEVEFHLVDVSSDDLTDILSNVDAVVHAAAYAELRHNWDNISERKKLFKNNEVATLNVLECMPPVPIIFLSSCSVYGSLSNDKIKSALIESDACTDYVESPYAASKMACEAYISAWSFKNKTPWYSLRLANQIGARAHRGVIVDFLKMIKNNNHIHAADNGEQKKNWVNVEDTADAVIALLEKKAESGVYNISSNERWSWRDITSLMLKMQLEKDSNSVPFTISNEQRLAGSIGDPINLFISNEKISKIHNCSKSVESAVIDCLHYLGWCK
jgi:UDP-glucose 4-epimerase